MRLFVPEEGLITRATGRRTRLDRRTRGGRDHLSGPLDVEEARAGVPTRRARVWEVTAWT